MINLRSWLAIRPDESDSSGALRRRFAYYLLPVYLADRKETARICDEQLDPTGNLLGYLRDLSMDRDVRKRLGLDESRTDPLDHGMRSARSEPPTHNKCLRCGQAVDTDQPTILCDGVVSKVVPLSVHTPVGQPDAEESV